MSTLTSRPKNAILTTDLVVIFMFFETLATKKFATSGVKLKRKGYPDTRGYHSKMPVRPPHRRKCSQIYLTQTLRKRETFSDFVWCHFLCGRRWQSAFLASPTLLTVRRIADCPSGTYLLCMQYALCGLRGHPV